MNTEDFKFYKEYGYCRVPKVLQIEITTNCPLSCPQCYKDLTRAENIEWRFVEKLVCEASKIGIKSIMINGGEPIIYPFFGDLVQLINYYGLHAATFISGVYLNKSIADKLKNSKLFLNISLNGSSEEINSTSRDGYKFALDAIHLLAENNIKYGINWVARHDNLRDLPNMLLLAEKYNAENIMILNNKINHWGVIESPLDTEDYRYLVNFLQNYRGGVRITIQRCFTLLNMLLITSTSHLLQGCGAGVVSCTVDLNGRFLPCSNLYYPEIYDSIIEYWRNSPVLYKLRAKTLKEKNDCLDCKKSHICHFCKVMQIETSQDFTYGLRNCPVKELFNEK